MVVLELEGQHSVAVEWDYQEGALTMADWHLSVSSLSMACRGACLWAFIHIPTRRHLGRVRP